jgi:2-hydroxychromene-2-carboxylate isomerase
MPSAAPVVEFYYDYASPWAYLASEILERALPGVPVELKPVYLRGFPQFRTGVPWDGKRLAYIAADLRRCAAQWEVPMTINSAFPVNGIHMLRGALWLKEHLPERFGAYHRAMFRATWRDDRPVTGRDVVIELAGALGVDATAFAAGLDDPAIKERLRAETDSVQARGAFGVPSFFLGGELYFGHDRMDYLLRAWQAARAAG